MTTPRLPRRAQPFRLPCAAARQALALQETELSAPVPAAARYRHGRPGRGPAATRAVLRAVGMSPAAAARHRSHLHLPPDQGAAR